MSCSKPYYWEPYHRRPIIECVVSSEVLASGVMAVLPAMSPRLLRHAIVTVASQLLPAPQSTCQAYSLHKTCLCSLVPTSVNHCSFVVTLLGREGSRPEATSLLSSILNLPFFPSLSWTLQGVWTEPAQALTHCQTF